MVVEMLLVVVVHEVIDEQWRNAVIDDAMNLLAT